MPRPNFDPDAVMDALDELRKEVASLKELRTIFAPFLPMIQDDDGTAIAMAAEQVTRLHTFTLNTLPEIEAMYAAAGEGGTFAALTEADREALRSGDKSAVQKVTDKLKKLFQP